MADHRIPARNFYETLKLISDERRVNKIALEHYGADEITLDGTFTFEQLESIVKAMREYKKAKA